jgi:hypothetical protein
MKDSIAVSAALAIHAARVETVLQALQAVLRELGHQSIDGVPISEWFAQKEAETLQDLLIRMEDMNPRSAALVQQHLDKLVQKYGDKKPPSS